MRRQNEDALLAEPPVFLVADGMGGHAGGRRASSIVVQEFAALDRTRPVVPADVLRVLASADQRVRELADSVAEDEGQPGTTVAGVICVDVGGRAYWLVLNVGDSRVYSLGEGGLQQMTVDHSLVQELFDAGLLDASEVRSHRDRHVITRALGAVGASEADCWLLPMTGGSRLFLCSDGLSGVLDDAGIETLLRSHDDPQAAADALLEAVVDRQGRDDVTVVVVDVHTESAQTQPASERTRPRASVDCMSAPASAYRGGDLVAITAAAGTIVGQGVPADAVQSAWDALSGNVGAAALVQLASSSAWLDSPSFCLVAPVVNGLSVLLRGDLTVTVVRDGRQEELTGRPLTSWEEFRVEVVLAITRSGDSRPETGAALLPFLGGVVHVSELVLVAGTTPSVPARTARPLTEPVVGGVSPDPLPVPVQEGVAEDDPVLQALVLEDPAPDASPETEPDGIVPETVVSSSPSQENPYDVLVSATIDLPASRRASAQTSLEEPPASVHEPQDSRFDGDTIDPDHDDMTVDGAEFRRRLAEDSLEATLPPLITGVPDGLPETKQNHLALRTADGHVTPVLGRVVVGREPSSDKFPASDPTVLVPLDSPTNDISRNHLEVRPGAPGTGVVLVVDLNSTNGTVVRLPGGARVDLQTGAAVEVGCGAVLDLGDGVVLTVVEGIV